MPVLFSVYLIFRLKSSSYRVVLCCRRFNMKFYVYVPFPFWRFYFDWYGSLQVLGVFLTAGYMVIKGSAFMKALKLWRTALQKLLQSTRYPGSGTLPFSCFVLVRETVFADRYQFQFGFGSNILHQCGSGSREPKQCGYMRIQIRIRIQGRFCRHKKLDLDKNIL